jgi:hypothetical protein
VTVSALVLVDDVGTGLVHWRLTMDARGINSSAAIALLLASGARGQLQIDVAAPVGLIPHVWVDMNPDEPGIQVARVVQPGIFYIDIVRRHARSAYS